MKDKNGTYNNIFISRSSTRDPWPVTDLKQFENTVVEHYRKTGFPFYSLTTAEKHKEFSKVSTYDHSNLIVNGEVAQRMRGSSLCWSYHPHSFSIQCGKMKSPIQVFESDALFHKAVQKRLKYGLNISDCGIRKVLRSVSGAQGVSGFMPLAAAALFHRFLPASGGTVWDMSGGWGGRMLGAMCCSHVSRYIACEPSSKTFRGLTRMRDELLPLLPRPLKVELYKFGSETQEVRQKVEPNSLDLCLTSPPYGPGHELYATESTQSCIRYPTYDEWLRGYLVPTLENCRFGLKEDGRLVINLAPTRTFPTLHTDFLRLAKQCGFRHVRTYRLQLSPMFGTRKPGQKFKHEPIYVFRWMSRSSREKN